MLSKMAKDLDLACSKLNVSSTEPMKIDEMHIVLQELGYFDKNPPRKVISLVARMFKYL